MRARCDPETNWNLKPEFKVYDGWTLPLPDGSVDRVVLYDAFHHLPNQERLLLEMRRVLTNRGIVGMSEPGRGHSTSAESDHQRCRCLRLGVSVSDAAPKFPIA